MKKTETGDIYLTAGALRSNLGLTESEVRKVRAAAGKGIVRCRQSQYCRSDKAYNMADVLALLDISAAPDEEK